MIDLHMHTTFSDGSISPEELVAMAIENGVKVIAITDHDNTLSYEAAIEAAKGHDLEIIPGIEINTHYEGHEVHVQDRHLGEGVQNHHMLSSQNIGFGGAKNFGKTRVRTAFA